MGFSKTLIYCKRVNCRNTLREWNFSLDFIIILLVLSIDLSPAFEIAGEGEEGQQGSAMSALIHSILSSGYQLGVSRKYLQRININYFSFSLHSNFSLPP